MKSNRALSAPSSKCRFDGVRHGVSFLSLRRAGDGPRFRGRIILSMVAVLAYVRCWLSRSCRALHAAARAAAVSHGRDRRGQRARRRTPRAPRHRTAQPPPPPRAPQPVAAPKRRRPRRPRRADLSRRAVPRVVRRRPRAALLPVRRDRLLRRLVAYYRTALKQKGELVFDAPATHEFDVGRFREETMAFPPGVTVKDYTSAGVEGLPEPEARRRSRRGSRPSSRSSRSRRRCEGSGSVESRGT